MILKNLSCFKFKRIKKNNLIEQLILFFLKIKQLYEKKIKISLFYLFFSDSLTNFQSLAII